MTYGEMLANDLDQAIAGGAWHGPALHELLANLSAEEAMQRPIPAAHNTWEIVVHIASWATIALRRMDGGQIEASEGEDWPEVHAFTPPDWEHAQSMLTTSYSRLSDRVRAMSDDDLLAKVGGGDRTIAGMVSGVAQHAAYHGGQIALLRKVVTTHHRRTAL